LLRNEIIGQAAGGVNGVSGWDCHKGRKGFQRERNRKVSFPLGYVRSHPNAEVIRTPRTAADGALTFTGELFGDELLATVSDR
jgi:hypothetical protein